jgi:hypothetical protein
MHSQIRHALIAAAFSAFVATATAIPSVSALAQEASTATISEKMQNRISDFVQASISLAAADLEGNPDDNKAVSDTRSKALVALVFHQPENLTELAAKTATLVEFSQDTERFALRMLVEDMNHLAGAK